MIQKYELTQEIFLTHYLRKCAKLSFETGKGTEDKNKALHFMSSIIFSSFTLEAFLNYVGTRILNKFDLIEKNITVLKKMEFVYAQIGLEYDSSARPVQTMKALIDFRNFMAHGKTIIGSSSGEIEIESPEQWNEVSKTLELDTDELKKGDSYKKWEMYYELCKEEFAVACLNDLEKVMSTLADATGLTDEIADAGGDRPIWERFRVKTVSKIG